MVAVPHLSTASLASIVDAFARHATATRHILAFVDRSVAAVGTTHKPSEQCSASAHPALPLLLSGDSHCSPAPTTACSCQRFGDSLLAYINRYHAFVTSMQDSLSAGVTPSLLELEGVFHPFFQQMEAVLHLLQGLTPDSGRASHSAVSVVEPAQLLTALYECYCTQSLLHDDAWTALLLCLFLAALEPYLAHLDTVSPPLTSAH